MDEDMELARLREAYPSWEFGTAPDGRIQAELGGHTVTGTMASQVRRSIIDWVTFGGVTGDGPVTAGEPEVSEPVSLGDLSPRVEEFAASHTLTRAAAIRELLSRGLDF